MIQKRLSILKHIAHLMETKRRSITFLFGAGILLLLTNGLIWSCATVKQKDKRAVSLYSKQILKEQSEAMQHMERELINHFGESVTLMLKNGFRFHQDSGLMGNSALMHYQSQSVVTDKQKDSSNLAYHSELSSRKDVELKTVEIEKQKSRPLSYWWLLLLFPLLWVIRKR